MTFPLEGIRVLDLTVYQQGPYASAMLADMGADVIKIESPATPDLGRGSGSGATALAPNGLGPYFQHMNRNKRGICLDLKSEAGRETFLRLIETADIFHTNMRPGVIERFNLTYPVVSARNPRIIMSNATGWGHLGPDGEAKLGSFDGLAQARGGIFSVNGTKESGPHGVGVPVADQFGAVISAYGMLVALCERYVSGRGQEVNTSLYGSQLCMQGFNITAAMWNGRNQELRGDDRTPHTSTYRCADGGLLMLSGSAVDRWWSDFCDVLGVPECAVGTYAKNSADREWRVRTSARLAERFATGTRDEWMQLLSPRFLVQPVRTYLEIAQDPQAWANGYLASVPREDGEPVPIVGVPVHLSRTPGSVRHLAPKLGEHTEEVLLEAGFDREAIAALRERGAFGVEERHD